MNTNQTLVEQISQLISDNQVINWSEYKQLESSDPAFWRRLKKMAAIGQALQKSQQDSEYEHEKALFSWGHLHVLERIGTGSFGEVFRAHDSTLDREVAVKLLKSEQISGYQTRNFIAEAKRMAKVRHPRVLAIHGANLHDERVGFWCDLISGVSLSECKDMHHSDRQVLQYATDLIDALEAIHEAGLVHGDVKCANIMKDQMGRLVLMDFGAGKQQDRHNINDFDVIGTPLYMAPELFRGDQKSPASDIYALGVVLYKLSINVYPVNAIDFEQLSKTHSEQPSIRQLKKVRSDISRPMSRLVHKMLSPSPASRPTVKEIKISLQHIRQMPEQRRKKWALASIIASLSICLLVVSLAYVNVDQARQITQLEKQKTDTVNEFLNQLLNSTAAMGRARDVRVVDLLQVAATSLEDRFADQPVAKAAMYHSLGNSYNSLRLPKVALPYLEKSLDLRRKIFKSNDSEVLKTQLEMAFSYHLLRNYDASMALNTEVIALAQSHQPPHAYTIALAQVRMAEIHLDMNEIDAAEQLLQAQISQLSDPTEASNNLPFLVLSTLARIHSMRSEYDQAEAVSRQARGWLSAYPQALETNKNAIENELAIALVQQGKLDEAEVLFEGHVAHSVRLFGANSRANIATFSNFSGFLRSRNKPQQALEYSQKAYDLAMQIMGPRDRSTLQTAITLANILVDLGDVTGGEELMRFTLSDVHDSLGESHQLALLLEYNLGELLNKTGRYIQAYELASKTHQKAINQLGSNHIYTLASADNMGVGLSGKGKHDEAIKMLQTTHQSIQESMGPTAPITLLNLQHLAEAFERAEMYDQSILTHQQLLDTQLDHLGETHDDTKHTQNQIYRLQNRIK